MGKRVSFILMGMLSIVTIGLTFMTIMAVQSAYPYTPLTAQWRVERDGEVFEDVTLTHLEDAGIADIDARETLVLTRLLPKTQEVPFPTLAIKTRYSAVEVFLEGESVYTYKQEEYGKEEFIGSRQHFVQFPRGAEGKEVRIELKTYKRHPFYYIHTPVFGNFDDVMQMFLHDHIFPLVSGVYLLVFGVIFLVISLFFVTRVPEMRVTMVSALLCIALSVWILPKYDLLPLFFDSTEKTTVEYMGLYMIPPLLTLIVWITGNYISKKGFYLYAIPTYAVVAWNLFGIITGAFPINRFRSLFFLVTGIVTVAVFIETLFCFRKKIETSDQIQMVSVSLLNLLLAMEFLFYYLEQHFPWFGEHLSGVMLPAGGLVFSLGQIMNFFIFVTRSYVQRAEAASLRRMAYEDILTGLPNRASYDREMRRLDAEGGSYCIISMDLNGLKETNDSLGHAMGDKLLTSFGSVMRDVFEDVGFLSRIGGDEFVVILRGATLEHTKADVERRLQILEEKLRQLDREEPRVLHSAATGYAFHEERKNANAHDIFLLADQRMYDNKRSQHSGRRPIREQEEQYG